MAMMFPVASRLCIHACVRVKNDNPEEGPGSGNFFYVPPLRTAQYSVTLSAVTEVFLLRNGQSGKSLMRA